MEVPISTADLGFVAGTDVVAIDLIGEFNWEAVAAPAFVCILGGSGGITFGSTASDTLLVAHIRVNAVELNLKLAARVVLFVATVVPIDRRAICSQRANLFGNGIA